MKKKQSLQRLATATAWSFAAALAAAGAPARADTGFVKLSSSGDTVLKTCNPHSSGSVTACKVTSLPGEDGYNLVASRSAPILVNGVTVGTQYEKVWRHCDDPTLYIFGVRVQMNANAWDASGTAFNVNDLLRQVRSDKAVSIAYFAGSPPATKLLQYAGRTAEGLNEYDGAQPDRNNGWADFRVDANAAEASGASSPNSPWLLTKAKAPKGYGVQSFAMRLLNSDVDENGDPNSIYTAAYQATCTTEACAPDGGNDD